MAKANRARGAESRYDKDFGGNHIQRERDRASARILLSPMNSRLCTRCKTRKPAKGGTGIGRKDGFICADCKPSVSTEDPKP